MADPFFVLPDCPEAAGLAVPPAIPTTPIVADCGVPDPPPPAYSCPPPVVPVPPNGSPFLYIRVTGEGNAWEAVESDGEGGWRPDGREGDGAWEMNGGEMPPGSVFLARKTPGTGELVFSGGDGFWCRSPDAGVPAATGPLSAREPQEFTADVYAASGGEMSLVAAEADVRWWFPDPCGGGKLLVLRSSPGGGYEAVAESCTPLPAS